MSVAEPQFRARALRSQRRRGLFQGGDAGAGEQQNLDAGRNTPGFFALEAKGGKCVGKGLAEAEAIEEIESRALRLDRIDGLGQQLQRAPAEDGAPHGRGCKLRTGAGQHAAGGRGPRSREERLNLRQAHGGAQSPAEILLAATAGSAGSLPIGRSDWWRRAA